MIQAYWDKQKYATKQLILLFMDLIQNSKPCNLHLNWGIPKNQRDSFNKLDI
jgi:hypothetical protein